MRSVLLLWLQEDPARAAAVLEAVRSLARQTHACLEGPYAVDVPANGTIEERLEILAHLVEDLRQRARIREGIARARREGKRLGRPPKYPPETARAIARARSQGASWTAIARRYDLPRTSTRQLYARAVSERDGHSLRGGEKGA
jgi:chorismate mutase